VHRAHRKKVQITWDLIKDLWQNIDTDGDGRLSEEEIRKAISMGILTKNVVTSLDENNDGDISTKEIHDAQEKCWKSGTLKLKT